MDNVQTMTRPVEGRVLVYVAARGAFYHGAEEKGGRFAVLKKGISLILALCLVLTLATPAWADNSLAGSLQGIVSYYLSHKTNLDHWEEVVALKTALTALDQDIAYTPLKMPDWKAMLPAQPDQNGQPNPSVQATDYAGLIIGILASGQAPNNIDGRHLIDELKAKQTGQGDFGGTVNNTLLSMMALDQANAQYNAPGAINYVLSQQKGDGGFAINGDSADPDMTGLALLALSKHAGESGASTAISKAVEALHQIQLSDGGFSSWGVENAESTAAVIRGLLAAGEDPASPAWTKNGQNPIDALFSFQLPDQSFCHYKGGGSDPIATRQALSAVAELKNKGYGNYSVRTGAVSLPAAGSTVRVRVEGATNTLVDDVPVTLHGTALDALEKAVGRSNVQESGGFINGIMGESSGPITGTNLAAYWLYYAILKDGSIDPYAFTTGTNGYFVLDGEELIFYLAALDSNGDSKTYLPVVSLTPAKPQVGQSVTLTISGKNVWGTENLSPKQLTDAIGSSTVTFRSKNGDYTTLHTQDGQVTIPYQGTNHLDFTVTNYNKAGYPNLVTYKGSIDYTPLPAAGNQNNSPANSSRSQGPAAGATPAAANASEAALLTTGAPQQKANATIGHSTINKTTNEKANRSQQAALYTLSGLLGLGAVAATIYLVRKRDEL